MATYAVFEPPLKDQSAGLTDVLSHAERFKFVRDGFSWLAFLFAPFWMLFNRLWLALVFYLLLMAVIVIGATRLGIVAGAVTLTSLVLALLIGFEAATLRRRKLLYWRWRDRGVVVADGRDSAEQRFFDRWVAEEKAAVAAPEVAALPPRQPAYDPDGYLKGQFSPKDSAEQKA
jgi:hypothetical protein